MFSRSFCRHMATLISICRDWRLLWMLHPDLTPLSESMNGIKIVEGLEITTRTVSTILLFKVKGHLLPFGLEKYSYHPPILVSWLLLSLCELLLQEPSILKYPCKSLVIRAQGRDKYNRNLTHSSKTVLYTTKIVCLYRRDLKGYWRGFNFDAFVYVNAS